MLGTLWIRADGSSRIGLGHLSRTSALAEAAAVRGIVATYVSTTDDLARAFLDRRGLAAQWLPEASDLGWVEQVRAGDAVVIDRYDVDEHEIAAVRASGAPVALLDDHGAPTLAADLVVNPNSDIDARHLPPSTVVATGPRYALVRSTFRDRRRIRSGAHERLVVTMGGSDTAGHGSIVVRALTDDRHFDEVVLIEGPGTPPTEVRHPRLSVVRDPSEIADVFNVADGAVSAAGASCWELLTMGIPTAVVAISDNQRGVAARATSSGAALALPTSIRSSEVIDVVGRLADPAVQNALSRAAHDLVDGLGAARVLDALEEIAR